MTSDALRAAAAGLLAAALTAGQAIGAAAPAGAAEPSYPFEGTWVRANRVCAANAPRVRTYTAQDVTFPTGHCTFRKVAKGGGQFQVFEDCRRAERPGNYTETIRMLGPDLIEVRRQAARLKIARPLRYARCSAAAPGGAPQGSQGGTQPGAPTGAAPGTAPGAAPKAPARPPEDHAAKPQTGGANPRL